MLANRVISRGSNISPSGAARAGGRPLTLLVVSVLAVMVPWGIQDASAATKKTITKATTKTTISKAAAKKKQAAQLISLAQNRTQRAKVVKARAKAASRVNALKSSDRKVSQSLNALTTDLRLQNAALGAARNSVSDAEAELADAQAAEANTRKELDALGGKRLQAALDAYIRPLSGDLSAYLNADGLDTASIQQTYIDVASRNRADVVDRLRALREDLTSERKRAEKADKVARQRRRTAAARLADLTSAKAKTEAFANDVESRLEAALAESASLSSLDKTLAGKIAAQQDDLARQLAAARRNGAKYTGGTAIQIGNVSVGSTHGIVVAASIRGKLAALLDAAQQDGIYLSGGGYRSSSAQVALRAAHCGGSSYGIYQAPASSCRPPTARPGQSMHERGLAVDFTQGGGTLTRGSAGYRWMRANAGRYGFINLPSEPWHWSTNGR